MRCARRPRTGRPGHFGVATSAAARPDASDRADGLRITAVTEDSISLAWSASTDNSGSIHHYVTCHSGLLITAPRYDSYR
jgi:hypothetical protein